MDASWMAWHSRDWFGWLARALVCPAGTGPLVGHRERLAIRFGKEKANRPSVALERYGATLQPNRPSPFPAYQSFMCTWLMCPSRAPPPSLFIHVFVWIMFVHKNILSSPCYHCLENRLYRCALCDETNKTRPHLHMFWRCLWNGSNLCGNLFFFL